MYSIRCMTPASVAFVLLTSWLAWGATVRSVSAAAALSPLSNSAPDYASRLHNRAVWSAFPLMVAFPRDANYREAREQWARRGFDAWLSATNGQTRYTIIADPMQAQILVRFDPTTNNGYTTTSFTNGRLQQASIRIGVQRGSASDAACIAAHEFGHALGIDGHSSDPYDVMYPDHRMGRVWHITVRDRNTLAVLYPALQQTSSPPPDQ